MARFLTLMRSDRSGDANAITWISLPWLLLIGVILAMPFVTGYIFPSIADSWPLTAGALLALLAALFGPRWARRLLGRIPAGDLLELVVNLTRRLRRLLGDYSNRRFSWPINIIKGIVRQPAKQRSLWTPALEQTLRLWPVTGTLALGICATLLLLLWMQL